MGSWLDIQNDERQLCRLAAQRRLYAEAKVIEGWRAACGALIPTILAGFAFQWSQVVVYASAYAVLWIGVDWLWLFTAARNRRASAALVQQEFDCDVLQLPVTDITSLSVPDSEVQIEAAIAETRGMELRDWYPVAAAELDVDVGRLVCQRANLMWDASLRRQYAWAVAVVGGVAALVLLGLALWRGDSVATLALRAVVVAPIMRFAAATYRDSIDVATAMDQLRRSWNVTWQRALRGGTAEELRVESSAIQAEILRLRRAVPPVWDRLYARSRDRHEESMNEMATRLVADMRAARRGGSPINNEAPPAREAAGAR